MQEAKTPDVPSPGAPSRFRRLHTFSGALVLGGFLVLHLLTNASALAGEAAYDSVVGSIARSKLLPILELFVLLPLAFHVGYGLQLLRAKPAEGHRRLSILQRSSAILVLVFVLGHLWELRVQRLFFGLSPEAIHTVLTAHLSWTWAGVPWIALLYLLGIAATALHFASGLFAASSTARSATVVLGVGLFLVGAATVVGFATGTCPLRRDATAAPCGSAAPIAVPPTNPSH